MSHSIGGYAGDGLPSAKLLSTIADVLITHPNVINGASMYWPMKNVLYVEGYALDEFAAGRVGLRPFHNGGHRIGLLLDKAIERDLRLRHLQGINSIRLNQRLVCKHNLFICSCRCCTSHSRH